MSATLNPGVVCGVAGDWRYAEVTVRIGCEQWLVTEVPLETARFWKQRISQVVMVDATAHPPSLYTREAR